MQAINLDELKRYRAPELDTSVRHIRERLTGLIAKRDRDVREIAGYPTSVWTAFNMAFGGARGELIVLTAETGTGKSSFARNWLIDTVRQGRPAFLVTLEDHIDHVAEVFGRMVVGQDIIGMSDERMAEIAAEFDQWPLFYLDHFGLLNEALLLNAIDYAAHEKQCKFMVVDHLEYIEKRGRSYQGEPTVIGDCVRRLAGKAHALNLTLVLIVHPAKMGVKGLGTRELGIDELKGASAIKQEADAVFSLYRTREEMWLRFLKIRNYRYSASVRKRIRFTMDSRFLTLNEVSGLEDGTESDE